MTVVSGAFCGVDGSGEAEPELKQCKQRSQVMKRLHFFQKENFTAREIEPVDFGCSSYGVTIKWLYTYTTALLKI